jgi:hypothetical protein
MKMSVERDVVSGEMYFQVIVTRNDLRIAPSAVLAALSEPAGSGEGRMGDRLRVLAILADYAEQMHVPAKEVPSVRDIEVVVVSPAALPDADPDGLLL